MDASSTENQGIQLDLLYACGWSFQDRVEVHTKAIAFSMLPWMHHQQRIKGFNQTRSMHVVDRSKIVLRYTPKPNKLSARCHDGFIINRESGNSTGPIVRVWLVPRSCWDPLQNQTSRQHAAMDAPSTENQGIQPDPLYACGWSFQDRVEVHTKAKQAFGKLPWMHQMFGKEAMKSLWNSKLWAKVCYTMLASKQRAGTTFWRAASCKNLALLNQIFRGATKAGIPRRISQRTVWAQTGPILCKCRTQSGTVWAQTVYLVTTQSGLRLCSNYTVWAQTVVLLQWGSEELPT